MKGDKVNNTPDTALAHPSALSKSEFTPFIPHLIGLPPSNSVLLTVSQILVLFVGEKTKKKTNKQKNRRWNCYVSYSCPKT